MGSRLKVDPEKIAAFARLEAADIGNNPKVKRLHPPRTRAAKPAAPARRKKMTAKDYRDAVLEMFQLQELKPRKDIPPYDVTDATRYPAAPLTEEISEERLKWTIQRYRWVLEPQVVTPGQLKMWRVHILGMTPAQAAALVRVTERTIRNWESGKTEIPFSMWWVVHCILQDPGFFLSRPGFHDFYIEYDRHTGEPMLCSYTWPDIRYTPTDLYVNRSALNEVSSLRSQLEAKEQEIERLTAENTRLRQITKASTVAAELSAMHAHIGDLLQQMSTADIVSFPESERPSQSVRYAHR